MIKQFLFVGSVFLLALPALGQEAAPASDIVAPDNSSTESGVAAEETEEAVPVEATAPPVVAQDDTAAASIAALEARMAEQEERLTSRIDELETAQEEAELAALPTGFEPSFNVFGFFDLTYNKMFPKEDGFFDGMVNAHNSFFMSNLNLYFKSEMTQTLSTMVELRFTFSPVGHESEPLEATGVSEFERVDTTVLDPYSSELYRLGGVKIERVHLTWQPRDYFGVIAGRFLTPYGIWNVDHGSPVIVAIRPPFSQIQHLVPLAQTGIQIFGTAPISTNTVFQYAGTLSNGRGPMDEVYDLDDSKAGGLKLRLAYDNTKVKFHLGGYGYIGQYTDWKRVLDSVSPFDANEKVTERYTEYIGTLDALLELKGLRIQAEFLRVLVKYKKRPVEAFGMTSTGGRPADHTRTSAYLMLAYTLPIPKLNDMKLTPYIMGEYVDLKDYSDSSLGVNVAIGMNFKPSPYVTLKLESYSVYFPTWHQDAVDAGQRDDALEHFWGLNAQMAVSF